jgi:hypothetical protein
MTTACDEAFEARTLDMRKWFLVASDGTVQAA